MMVNLLGLPPLPPLVLSCCCGALAPAGKTPFVPALLQRRPLILQTLQTEILGWGLVTV